MQLGQFNRQFGKHSVPFFCFFGLRPPNFQFVSHGETLGLFFSQHYPTVFNNSRCMPRFVIGWLCTNNILQRAQFFFPPLAYKIEGHLARYRRKSLKNSIVKEKRGQSFPFSPPNLIGSIKRTLGG